MTDPALAASLMLTPVQSMRDRVTRRYGLPPLRTIVLFTLLLVVCSYIATVVLKIILTGLFIAAPFELTFAGYCGYCIGVALAASRKGPLPNPVVDYTCIALSHADPLLLSEAEAGHQAGETNPADLYSDNMLSREETQIKQQLPGAAPSAQTTT